MEIVIQKFGGTSVADLDKIRNVANIIKTETETGKQIVAIVSAMAGATNALITKCSEISKLERQSHLREYDAALASGEIITSSLLALQLQSMGLQAKSLQGWQIPLKTDDTHGNSQIIDIDPKILKQLLQSGIIPVITGFQGITPSGDVSTLGKGGSDTSAALIAASLNAIRCDIYTDVDGVYSADPRIVHTAKKIDVINIDELYALCIAGAKVLHPRAALAAKRYSFPMRILSSFADVAGTIVEIKETNMESKLITAITSNKNLLKIDIEHNTGDFAKIIGNFVEDSISIEQTYNFGNGTATIIANLTDKNKCQKLLEHLKNDSLLIKKYELSANISTVTIVGYGIKNNKSLSWKLVEILTDNSVEIFASHLSDIKMSILIDDQNNEKVIKLLHDYCFDK